MALDFGIYGVVGIWGSTFPPRSVVYFFSRMPPKGFFTTVFLVGVSLIFNLFDYNNNSINFYMGYIWDSTFIGRGDGELFVGVHPHLHDCD
jgi:hypothetical protein